MQDIVAYYGEPPFSDTYGDQVSLKQDIALGLHEQMSPLELRQNPYEYQEISLKRDQDNIPQEKR
jgi:hypothetical protein